VIADRGQCHGLGHPDLGAGLLEPPSELGERIGVDVSFVQGN
jgi:hypothetical protein